ncbi:eCIS core domain-containing protein [Aquimarina aggregata]|uniref:eCIS core domain-containing protein n=1 Tax=Aquimarina aggregata TaxID=1642818 RepID=UPI0024930EB3|nr:DUF4157 domain-containing protein [Aquimarina aggregata]
MKIQANKTQEPQNSIIPKVTIEPSDGGTTQLMDNRTATIDQRKLKATMNTTKENKAPPIQRRANNTGLPNNLKSGIENLSGYSMDDVKVHYNSSKPAQLQAHAYAQGTDIHLASGQEKHLPHEAWHVVQQKQGRVKPTRQLKSKVNINDDAGLEKEADVMGEEALRLNTETDMAVKSVFATTEMIQRKIKFTEGSGEGIYSKDNIFAFFSAYLNLEGLEEKQEDVINLINSEEVHHFKNPEAMIRSLGPIEKKEKKEPIFFSIKGSAERSKEKNPFESEDFSKKLDGVASNLHTVWVGGVLSDAAKERLLEWSQVNKMELILWMDQSAMEKSNVQPINGNVNGIPTCGILPLSSSVSIQVSSVKALHMNRTLQDASEAEAIGGRPQVASDIVRIAVLHKYGGTYMDVGGVSKGTEEIDPSTFKFVGGMDLQPGYHKETGHLENGLIIAKKNSPILKQMLSSMIAYYKDNPEKRIQQEQKFLKTEFENVSNPKTKIEGELLEYLTNKEAADKMVSNLVKMDNVGYNAYMTGDDESEDIVRKIMKRWKGYIDHLRTTPLGLLTDKIRPHELERVGTLVSSTINDATMGAFQFMIEKWMEQEESNGTKNMIENLFENWTKNYKNSLFKYGQKGYSWQNPGLSAAEEKERLMKKNVNPIAQI